ncbi:MAG: SpoIIE family protein phosphatase, partial [Ruminococcus sp.]|nr:SpoIIE family protein phosphatase [Ruminococcus sp.]
YINAGHCKPLIHRSGTGFEFVKERPDFVVAGEESVPYTRRELKLCSGDALFLYTDGVTEAVDTSDELYGDDRLRTALNAKSTSSAREICETVRKDLTLYSDGATQTDDITMLAVVFNGMRLYREITVEAKVERLSEVNAFLEEQLDASEFDMRSATQICVIADDVCSNIVYYAYPDKDNGMMKVAFSFDPKTDEAEITFTDSGIPFNPLNVPEPDISKIEEGDEGGLGIMLVRKFSDKLLYEYSNGQNILKIIKKRNKNKTE